MNVDPSSDIDDDDFDYDEREGEWCDRCQGSGIANCYCGGDQCYCENYGEMECPTCDGEGYFVPTEAFKKARAENAEMWRALHESIRRDSDGSPKGGDGLAGSVHDSAGPKDIATPPSSDPTP